MQDKDMMNLIHKYMRGWAMVLLLLAGSCVNIRNDNPYEADICDFSVTLTLAPGEKLDLGSIEIKAEDVIGNNRYSSMTDGSGTAHFSLPKGLYRFNAGRKDGENMYNAAIERTSITAETKLEMPLIHSFLGPVVIKEIYCGGCKQFSPEGEYLGDYQSDKYAILHNNSDKVQYLDSLCIATLAPYNSPSNPPMKDVRTLGGEPYMDVYAPVIQAMWQFGGDGKSFPLAPGEDAIVAFNGAVDHTALYGNSINLNREDCFACYNITYFTNERYHPAPGDRIRADHIMNCVLKLGQANAYTVSISSPAMIIFRIDGCTAQQYVTSKTPFGDDPVMQLPGSAVDKILNIPWVWVIDAVEVFSSISGNKRINVCADAGYVVLSDTYLGHSLMRKLDEEATEVAGYEVLVDSNNSSEDFYEREIQSLHE